MSRAKKKRELVGKEANPILPSRLLSLVMLVVWGYLALALISFNIKDPSFNRATNLTVSNAAGEWGAAIADPLYQLLGVGIILLVAFKVWQNFTLLRRKAWLMWPTSNYASYLLVLLVSIFVATIPTPEFWFYPSLGGWLGTLLLTKVHGYKLGWPIFGVLLFFSLTWLFGLERVCNGLRHTGRAIKALWHQLKLMGKKLNLAKIKEPNLGSSKKPKPKSDINGVGKEVTKGVSINLKEDNHNIVSSPKLSPVGNKAQASKLPSQAIKNSTYIPPSLDILQTPQEKRAGVSVGEIKSKTEALAQVLQDFGVQGEITTAKPGPVVTLYELEPAAGTKSARVIGLADDIARSMSAISARIALVPGRNIIGIELPNPKREVVLLREILNSTEFQQGSHKLPLALGKNIGGEPIIADLAKMPHLLVAGTTGSGKSVGVNSMILSLLYKLSPDQCKFIMIDPKMLELSVYQDIPHLLCPVVTDPGKAVAALKWVVREMESRYRLMSNLGVRNLDGFNQRINEAIAKGEELSREIQTGFDPATGKPIYETLPIELKPMPYIVVVVDEMADLMLVAGKDIETSIQRLAQMARAAGIHLIMATQRPSVDVITGVIKANFPTRISFQVTSKIDSRTILGEQGAEQLLGMGDMLYLASGSRITRVHGAFVGDREVEQIVRYLHTLGEPEYIESVAVEEESFGGADGFGGGEGDDLYQQAVAIVRRERKASTSFIQRCLRIGYNRAANIIEQMEKAGVVSPANHSGKREVLLPEE